MTRLSAGRSCLKLSFALLGLSLVAAPAAAQDSVAVRTDSVAGKSAAPKAARKYPSPGGALARSFAVPGWGQLALGRKVGAGFFLAAEALTLGMTIKTSRDLNAIPAADSVAREDKARAREDWIVLLVANHLLSGLEAFVAGHLTDYPGELKFSAGPRSMHLRGSLPVRF